MVLNRDKEQLVTKSKTKKEMIIFRIARRYISTKHLSPKWGNSDMMVFTIAHDTVTTPAAIVISIGTGGPTTYSHYHSSGETVHW